jgi:short-subunit dehydrogenase
MTMSDAGKRLRERYGPWAVVTGASSGIGRAAAGQLAAAGLDLVLVARRGALLEELAADLRDRYGIATLVRPTDLADRNSAEHLAEATAGVDVGLLVAAAGYGQAGPFLDTDLRAELNLLDVNTAATLILCHRFGARFARRGRGGIVLLSSLVAFQGVPGAAHYAATKAYVQTLAEGLHAELVPHGVDILAVAPGPVHTGFADRAGMRMGRTMSPDQVVTPALRALGRRASITPGGRSKFLSWSLATLPRWGRVAMMGSVMRGMTAHQNSPATSHV